MDTLVKKTRCPKGQTRNKEGNCVPKSVKVMKINKTAKKSPRTKTMKKQMTASQAAKILVQRRKCIERFRNHNFSPVVDEKYRSNVKI